jgi:hypothetical protein
MYLQREILLIPSLYEYLSYSEQRLLAPFLADSAGLCDKK